RIAASPVGTPLVADIVQPTAPAPVNQLQSENKYAVRQIAYSYQLALEMAPDGISKRFERARQECLTNAALKCLLVRASVQAGEAISGISPSAILEVRLPHDTIDTFEQGVSKPLDGEQPGDLTVRSRSTTAEDVTEQVMDVDQHLAQQTDYRERLNALAKRTD